MNLRRLLTGATACGFGLVVVAGSLPATASGAPAKPPAAEVDWHPCPKYSDKVLRAMMHEKEIPAFRKQWARTQCGKVKVPLNYAQPGGRRITVAITRLPATDRAHRKGSLAFNPGGPGGSGYLMPLVVTLVHPPNAELNKRYDLIGFDPRGIGYSSKVECQYPDELPPLGSGPVTEADARKAHTQLAKRNADCGRLDPAFLSQITTPNIARDLDRVRAALGDRKLSYYGGSWGTWLGAVYRSEFPRRAERFWLDSPMPPKLRMDALQADGAKAAARNFGRMARWIAKHHETYGFGTSGRKVEAALARLAKSYDANPRKFTDLRNPLDGYVIGDLASWPSTDWPFAAKALRELRDATGPTAPPTVKEMFGPPPPPPPDGFPELFNLTMSQASFCNEDSGSRDFESWWAAYQDGLKRYPVTGRFTGYRPPCAGWPLPVRQPRLKHSNGSLVLSGHRHENVTPYEWTWRTRSAIGGTVQTVNDDVHSAVLDTPECAAKLREYFATGHVSRFCPGVPEPATTNPDQPERSLLSADVAWPLDRRAGLRPRGPLTRSAGRAPYG